MKAFIRHHLARIGGATLIAALAVAALPGLALADEQIQGTVQSINGTWNITVMDVNGYLDNVGLHQGTIINPTGLTLAPGMSVTILGFPDGNVFQANEIDTPYQYSGPVPVPVYYGPGWWYPGYAYGYGPSFSLVLNFGGDRDDFWIARQPWGGSWWVSQPVHPYVGFWMGHHWDGDWHANAVYSERRYTQGRAAYRAPETRTYAPAYRAPEARTYAPAYRAPEARTYAPAQRYSAPAQRYSAPTQRYSAPTERYSAPTQRYSAPTQRYSAPTERYNGGARATYSAPSRGSYSAPAHSGGGRESYGGGRSGESRSNDRGDHR